MGGVRREAGPDRGQAQPQPVGRQDGQAHRRVHAEEGLCVAAAVDQGRGALLPPQPQQRDRRLQGNDEFEFEFDYD